MTSGTGPPRLVQAAPASLVGPILNGVFPIEVVDGRDKPGRDEESFQGERRIDHDALRMAVSNGASRHFVLPGLVAGIHDFVRTRINAPRSLAAIPSP
ncbi:hypothetical protein, partial [Enterobacter kobei]|uniref:hypothetical protein n=1 Tax=Enterobacter kobei TaxID=208224 RepID=UPI001952CAED